MRKDAPTFTKEQILRSRRFEDRRDLLGALLKDNKRYTVEAVDALIENYMKGEVK